EVETIIADQNGMGHPEEQSRADDAGDCADRGFRLGRLRQGLDAAINDVVTVVADEKSAVPLTGNRDETEFRQAFFTQRQGERDHLDWQSPSGAQDGNLLARSDKNDQFPRRGGDDLLPHQGAAKALDQIEIRGNLVRSVHYYR